MGTEKQRAGLDQRAHRHAFDRYLRHGRATERYLSETADGEQKSRDSSRPRLSKKALGEERPTNRYIWRTARDERVRSSHAANVGRIFRLERSASHRTSRARTQLPLLGRAVLRRSGFARKRSAPPERTHTSDRS